MADFLTQIPLFPVFLTVGTFLFGQWCQKKTKLAICNPVLIAMVLCIGILLLTGVEPDHYQAGTKSLTWLLTPATVCLALPMYEQLKNLKRNLPAILAGIIAGTVTSLLSVGLLCRLFALDTILTISLLPKSITSSMGMVLSQQNGGISALTTVVIILTGILGSITGPALCRILRITDPISQGVAYGTSAHVIGTAKAHELGALQGAVSSLSLSVAGIVTTVLFPVFLQL